MNENLNAKMEFDTFGEKQKDIAQKSLGQSLLGLAPSELIADVNSSIGNQILKSISQGNIKFRLVGNKGESNHYLRIVWYTLL